MRKLSLRTICSQILITMIKSKKDVLSLKNKHTLPDRIDKYIMAIESVKRSTMTGIIARLKSKYTSVTNYIITELGVSQSEIEFLRSSFLTDNA